MKSLAVIALLLGGTSSVVAQYAPRVEAGDRVRLRTSSWFPGQPRNHRWTVEEVRGTVEEVRADTIVIRTAGDSLMRWAWAPDAPTQLFLYGGRKSSWARGLAYGTLVGVAVGAGLGLASGDDPPGTWFAWTAGEKALIAGAALGVTGALVGLVAGGLSHHDVWVPAGVQPKVRPIIGLSGRPGLTVSVDF